MDIMPYNNDTDMELFIQSVSTLFEIPYHTTFITNEWIISREDEDAMNALFSDTNTPEAAIIDYVDWANEQASDYILNFTQPRTDESECPICLGSMQLEDTYVTKCCRHSFHRQCWVTNTKKCNNTRCPLCRTYA